MSCDCLDRMHSVWTGACFGRPIVQHEPLDLDVVPGPPRVSTRMLRYNLWRRWDERPPLVAIMLNPSTADENVLDPTLRRVRGYAERWGNGGFIIGNAFALRSTDPDALLTDPRSAIGIENDAHLRALVAIPGATVMVGWGANLDRPSLRFRQRELQEILGTTAFCWDLTRTGAPVHPLYQPADITPKRFTWATM